MAATLRLRLFRWLRMKTVRVAQLTDLEPGTCLSVEAEGIGIALFNVAGAVYALDNTCPHAGGPLGEGTVTGMLVTCPWHGWRYDVRTGTRPENPDIRVACYPVRIEGNEIHVSIPEGSSAEGLSR
jgi:nitrite reductase (NADH) small subunit/3-phenylpropionate/trans-cinnamate dioxygenase ferredoxin subunit